VPRILAWLYSHYGSNFISATLKLLGERDEFDVVGDQTATPTWERSLAEVLWAAVRIDSVYGIFHWIDSGVATWNDFAAAINELGARSGLLTKRVRVSSRNDAPRRRSTFSPQRRGRCSAPLKAAGDAQRDRQGEGRSFAQPEVRSGRS
jgi:dTDP-4-dehydrorhamnose reductase